MSYFCDIANREAKEIAPGVRIRTFWQDHMLLAFVDLDPESVVPLHSHPHEQSGTVVRGELTMTIDGEARRIQPGDCYVIPGGVTHKAVAGPQGAQVVDVFSPVREEYQY